MVARRLWIVAALVAASFAARPADDRGHEPSRAQRTSRLYTIEQFMDTTRMSGASFSADESRILISSDQTGIFNAYTVPVAGGPPTPVTRSTVDSTYVVSFFPKDDRILFTHDRGGIENNHIYLIRDGQEQDLTPGKILKASYLEWCHDGSAFYIQSNERNLRFFDLHRLEVDGSTRSLVCMDEVGYQAGEPRDAGWLTRLRARPGSVGYGRVT